MVEAGNGRPKITDFGLARQMDSDSGETQLGAVMQFQGSLKFHSDLDKHRSTNG